MIQKKQLSILSFLFLFLSCKQNNYDWKVYNSDVTNLKSIDEKFNKILNIDNSVYLFGSRDESTNMTDMEYVVYKSVNFGKNWELILEGNGDIVNAFYANQDIYLVKENYKENSFKGFKTTLLKFNIKTGIIESVHQFKKESSIIDGILDDYESGSLIISNSFSSTDNSIFKTSDNFNSCDSIYIGKSIKKNYFFKNKIYLLTYELILKNYKVQEQNKLYIIDKDDNRDSLYIESNINDFVVDIDGILLLGKKEEDITLNYFGKKEDVNITSIIRAGNLEPQKIYKYKSFIAVLLSSTNEHALGGFGGSEYHLFLSFDNGKVFKEEELPIKDYVGQILFYKDEKIIIYSGSGRISVCKLKKTI